MASGRVRKPARESELDGFIAYSIHRVLGLTHRSTLQQALERPDGYA